VAVLALASLDSEAARRLGGGGSIGRQSSSVTQREATRSAPAAPANNQASPNAQPGAQPGAAPVAPAPKRPWGAMLGGLAAGLGLAWLANSLGLGAAFGQFLLVALLVMIAVAVIGAIARRRQPPAYAYQGAGAADTALPPRQYSPDKVGNDASARPWERSSMAFEPDKYASSGSGVQVGLGLAGSQTWGIPAGFDTEGFVSAAKRNFVTLQDAWDRADIAALRSMMTDEMLGEIKTQLAEREQQQGGNAANKTDVVMLDAKLLGIEETDVDYMASVEFSGMIREEPSAGPSSFREVWNMTKAKTGPSGWLVAGVQALQ
jgi:predicted lipid-binding transport protein (Tim44 family)